MIGPEVEDQIMRLARGDQGRTALSQRTIARILGVSRGTVANRIHNGPRPRRMIQISDSPAPASGPVGQCPVHGRMRLPCLACHLTRILPKRTRIYCGPEPGGPIRVELAGGDCQRYEQVRAAALARGDLGGDLGGDAA